LGLAVHDLTAVQQAGQLFIELHLEVDENLSLREAHRQATELEEKIRDLRDGPIEVNIHIEPLGRHIATPDTGVGEMKQLSRAIEEFLNRLPSEFDELVNCHDARARQVEHHILVSCHCTMKGSLPITQIHDVTAVLEDRVKESFRRSIASQFTPNHSRKSSGTNCSLYYFVSERRAKACAPSAINAGKQTRT